MKWVTINRYVPLQPENGYGFTEGTRMLCHDNALGAFDHVLDRITLEEPDESRIYRGQDLSGKILAFYYPGGLGDSACHTAIIAQVKRRYPTCSIRVFANINGGNGAVWYLNPSIDERCARPGMPTWAAMQECDYWMLGDSVVYRLTAQDQPNIYDVLGDHFHVRLTPDLCRPHIYVAKEEADRLYTRLALMLGADIREDALCLFAPCATRVSRSLPEAHWVPTVERIQAAGYRVIISGSAEDVPALRKLDGKAIVLANCLTAREYVVLCNEVVRCVTVDSAALHLCAAFGIPTVGIFGPFAPRMRSVTYAKVRPIWSSTVCHLAPCCWHDAMYPTGCPTAKEGYCGVVHGSVSMPEKIMNELMVFENEKPNESRPPLKLYNRQD